MKLFAQLLIATLLTALAAPATSAQVYATGLFNGWNALNPMEFTRQDDGIYTLTIDFSKDTAFKLSTVKGTTGNGWTEFDSGILSFTTTTPAAGEWLPIEKSGTTENMQAPAKCKLTIYVDLDNMRAKIGNDDEIHAWSGTLPVLFINTENNTPITSKEDYLTATYYLDAMGVEGVSDIGTAEAPLTMQIRGRGNYTWTGFDKKPYRLKLTDKQPMLGMTKSKHWALLANADDNMGFMRNFTGFTASELLGMPWTPASQPCEVVLNGDYIGLYFLTETIRVDKDRVNVVEQEDNATTDVDGGWLVEIDNYDTDPHVTVNENGNAMMPIWFTYKSPEILSAEQHDYLQSQMQAIDNAIYSSALNNIQPLAQLVDLDILARFYICQELLDDTESFHGSCYLNRQRGADEKWKFGPVWDFGNGMGRKNSQKFIYQDPTFSQVWIGTICRFPAFQEVIRSVWKEFLNSNGADNLLDSMNAFADYIAAAAVCDAARWPAYGNADELTRAAEAHQFVSDRITWLKSQWGEGGNSGISDITAGNSDARTEYYNLNGIRIDAGALTPGLYVRRTGTSAEKVIIR